MPTARLKDRPFRHDLHPRRRMAAGRPAELRDESPLRLVRLVRAGLPFAAWRSSEGGGAALG